MEYIDLNRSNGEKMSLNWIDSKKEGAMHPVNYLFEDIYRNQWGFPQKGRDRVRRPDVASLLQRSRPARHGARRD